MTTIFTFVSNNLELCAAGLLAGGLIIVLIARYIDTDLVTELVFSAMGAFLIVGGLVAFVDIGLMKLDMKNGYLPEATPAISETQEAIEPRAEVSISVSNMTPEEIIALAAALQNGAAENPAASSAFMQAEQESDSAEQ